MGSPDYENLSDWDKHFTCEKCENDVSQCVCHNGMMSDKEYRRLTTKPRKRERDEDDY